jgi:hypothetical protein
MGGGGGGGGGGVTKGPKVQWFFGRIILIVMSALRTFSGGPV